MSDGTYARRLAGDWDDDDGEVLDSFVQQQPMPLDQSEAVAVVTVHDKRPPRTTRVLSGYQTIDANTINLPLFILPADHDRLSIMVRVDSATPGDVVFFADEQNKVAQIIAGTTIPASGQTMRVPAGAILDLGSHTGALWCVAKSVTTPATVSWWGVIK